MVEIRKSTAVVVPVHFPPGTPRDAIDEMLQRVLTDTFAFIDPGRLVFVCDGDQPAWEILGELGRRKESRFRAILQDPNAGKGAALVTGMNELTRDSGIRFIISRDSDGNHFAWDMPRMMAVAEWLMNARRAPEVVVVGARSDRARAIGLVRSEMEELLNLVAISSLAYHLAHQRGEVLGGIFPTEPGRVPDLHSGYKLYSRGICRRMCELPWEGYGSGNREAVYRYGMELVPFVEAVLMGASVAETTRLGHVQRVTGHGAYERPEVIAELLCWTFSRLDLPTTQAVTTLDNILPVLRLFRDPESREKLGSIKRLTLEVLAKSRCEPVPESELPILPDYF
jgi:hypothetical protein